MENIIQAVFRQAGVRSTRVAPRYRYNYGQILQIVDLPNLPDVYEVHFGNVNSTTAMRMIASGNEVSIPDELFQSGADIVVWIFVHETANDGTTVYKIDIPIIERQKPEDYEPTPEEAGIVEQAIELLNHEIADIENAHNNAVMAQEAQAAAEAAQGAAEQAQDIAEGARDSALEYMDTAVQKAGEAAQSASDAAAAKAAAEAAAELAEQHNMGVTTNGNTLVFSSLV